MNLKCCLFDEMCPSVLQDFAIDVYPFYPPLVKVIRPRLEASSLLNHRSSKRGSTISFSVGNTLSDVNSLLIKWDTSFFH